RHLLGENYAGFWDVVRYSKAPHNATDEGPWIVRAAMQVGPIDENSGRKEPWFLIHYRPQDDALRQSTGSIMMIDKGHHFCITGVEHDSDAPIYVIAKFVRTKVDFFRGLVIRRHSHGDFVSSRVVFIRRPSAKTIDELEKKINVYREAEFIRQTKDIPKLARH